MRNLLIVCFLFSTGLLFAQDIQLPEPVKTGGKPLMEALSERQSIKVYTGAEIDNQTMSNLLWAAYGFNRADKRTVPSSQNRQEIDVYVMLKDAVYLYDAQTNTLKLQVQGDFRKGLGNQQYVYEAALNLVFVANMDKASNRQAAFIDTGYISQNVYLFSASAGLGSVARGSFNGTILAEDLKLGEKQEVTLVQAVGVVK